MPLIREILLAGRWRAASQVEAWGYPRRVSHREVATGSWFTNERAIVWYVTLVAEDDERASQLAGVLAVHGIGSPEARKLGRVMDARSVMALEVIGELLGAHKLYSLIPRETPDMPVKAMRRYLRRYGWVEDEIGSYKLLGDG